MYDRAIGASRIHGLIALQAMSASDARGPGGVAMYTTLTLGSSINSATFFADLHPKAFAKLVAADLSRQTDDSRRAP